MVCETNYGWPFLSEWTFLDQNYLTAKWTRLNADSQKCRTDVKKTRAHTSTLLIPECRVKVI